MIFILGGNTEGKNYLSLNADNSLVGSESLDDARKFLPDLNRYHVTGSSWSSGATLWWLSFSPKIYCFENIDDLSDKLESRNVFVFSSMVGSVRTLILKKDYVPVVAANCELIKEHVATATPFYELQEADL